MGAASNSSRGRKSVGGMLCAVRRLGGLRGGEQPSGVEHTSEAVATDSGPLHAPVCGGAVCGRCERALATTPAATSRWSTRNPKLMPTAIITPTLDGFGDVDPGGLMMPINVTSCAYTSLCLPHVLPALPSSLTPPTNPCLGTVPSSPPCLHVGAWAAQVRRRACHRREEMMHEADVT